MNQLQMNRHVVVYHILLPKHCSLLEENPDLGGLYVLMEGSSNERIFLGGRPLLSYLITKHYIFLDIYLFCI